MKKLVFFLFFFKCGSLVAQNTYPWPTTGNIGIGTTTPTESLDVSAAGRFGRIRTGSSIFYTNSRTSFNSFNSGYDRTLSTGWIAADFGGEDNSSDRVVIGSGFGGKAVLGVHNYNLTSWSGPLLIAPFGGNVGIGTTNPSYKLDIGGTTNVTDRAWFSYGNNNISGYSWVNAALTTNSIEIVNNNSEVNHLSPTLAFHRYMSGGPQFRLAADGTNVLYLESSGENSARSPLPYGGGPNSYFTKLYVDGGLITTGNVGVGISNPTDKLAVNGTIHSKEVKVDIQGWPDYVFQTDYQQKSLSEIEAYIQSHKHLPEVPAAKEIESSGLLLGEMNKILLKKIEELTLHLIDKDKQLNEQEAKIKDQDKRLSQVEEIIKQFQKK
jgi:hypothetical protein